MKIKIGHRVNTIDGDGEVIAIAKKRIIVKLYDGPEKVAYEFNDIYEILFKPEPPAEWGE